MNLLFISYWSLNDGLTQATVIPHLEILSKFKQVGTVHFITVEREAQPNLVFNLNKVKHHPIFSKNLKFNLLNKVNDLFIISSSLSRIANNYDIDLIICRSAMAGMFGEKLHSKYGMPYVVESFEPHADYMIDTGTWAKYDPRYISQIRSENKQKKNALFLIPVSNAYKEVLINEGISKKRLEVIPCCVNSSHFSFSKIKRKELREQLNINGVTGIYVGKFGDLYYDSSAYRAIRQAFEYWPNFELIILSPQSKELILEGLTDIDPKRLHIKTVAHKEVSGYLSASDFAFSFHRKTSHSYAFSPIKNGEYMANGLPIITSIGIGDDSDIIEQESIGVSLNLENDKIDFNKIDLLINQASERQRIAEVAKKNRSFLITEEVYSKVLNSLTKTD